jgi:DNA-binding NarL/FixJ family response regulator
MGGVTAAWVDDGSLIYRTGLVTCLIDAGFRVAGVSACFAPEPDLSSTDVLLFDIDAVGLKRAVQVAQGTSCRLVGIARCGNEQALLHAVEAGLAGFLVRSDITPQSLTGSLNAVAAGNSAMPTSLVADLIQGVTQVNGNRNRGPYLVRRELDVLRILAEGGDTRQVASALSYSERTVKNIVHDILVKMNCKTRVQAVAAATRQGFI